MLFLAVSTSTATFTEMNILTFFLFALYFNSTRLLGPVLLAFIQICKDLMKDLIKKEYSFYHGPDGRSDTTSSGAEKLMSERKIFRFSIRSFLHHTKLALSVNIVSCFSMI